jgi:hypothetical protein
MLNFGRKNTEKETIPDKKKELECDEEIIAEKISHNNRVRKAFIAS